MTRPVTRVVVAEDQWAVRSGLVLILSAEPDIEVVAEAADGAAAVAAAHRLRPDVVLMDIRMPKLDGISATRELAGTGCDVLILTTFNLDEYVFDALRAGAVGFLLKDIAAEDLVDAVRLVARGEGLIAPTVTRQLIQEFARGTAAAPSGGPGTSVTPAAVDTLTIREREVLAALGDGLSNRQIARRLGISETTIKTHVSRVLAKLDLRSRVQAAIAAQELGVSGTATTDPPRRPGDNHR